MKKAFNPFKKKKKISMDINGELLNFIDELAETTKSNRTLIIEAIIGKGAPIFLNELERTWQGLLIKGNLKDKEKQNIKYLLLKLKKSRENWKRIEE